MSNSITGRSVQDISSQREERKLLLQEAARRGANYLDGLDDRPVFPGPEALAGLIAFDEILPADPQDALETLSLLDAAGSPAAVSVCQAASAAATASTRAWWMRSPTCGPESPCC